MTTLTFFIAGAYISTRPRKGASLPPNSLDMEPDARLKNTIFPDAGDDKVSQSLFAGWRRWFADSFAVRGANRRARRRDADKANDSEARAFEVTDEDGTNCDEE